MISSLLNAREKVTRSNIQSLRRLILENIAVIYNHLDPVQQVLLIDDLFLPLDFKDLNKLLDLVLKYKNRYFIQVILEFYSLEWICKQFQSEENGQEWEDWINLIFSVYARCLMDLSRLFKEFISLICTNGYGIQKMELEKFIAKVTRTGNLSLFLKVADEMGIKEFTDLVLKLSIYEQEMFLCTFLDFIAIKFLDSSMGFKDACERFITVSTLNSCEMDNSIQIILENRFFDKFQDYNRLHLLVHSLATNQGFLVKFGESLLRNWGNSNLVSSNSVKSSLNYTNLLLLVIRHLDDSYLSNLKLKVIGGVSLYLDSTHKVMRNCGMIIGQFYTERVKDGQKLDFELKSQDIQDFKVWMSCETAVTVHAESQDQDFKSSGKVREPVKPNKEMIKTFRYMQDSLQLLKSGDDADPEKIELAMASLPSLILTASEIEISEIGEKIAEKVIYFTNDYEIQTLDDYRMKSMVCLLIRLPKTMPKYFANQIYSRNSGMMQRMDMLLSIGYACAELSERGNFSDDKLEMISVRGEIVPFQKSKSFSELCLYFFNPLMSEIHKWSSNDGTSISYIFISRTLSTLGLILKCAANSSHILTMSRDLFNLLLQFRDCPIPIRSGVLEGLIMIITSLSPNLLKSEFTSSELELVAEIALHWTKSQDSTISDLAFSFLGHLSHHVGV